jgi:hypothetical protein
VLAVTVTATDEMKVPPLGLSAGVAAGTWIVYVALATALGVYPDATAIALSVCVVVTVIGPVYAAEDVVGALPSVV